MAETAFNTIAEVQRLRDAGFEQAQAEAITLSIHAGVTGGVATKADLENVERLLRSDIENVEQRLDAKIESTAQDLDAKIENTAQLSGLDLETRTELVRKEIATAKFDLSWRLLTGFAIINGMMLALLRFLPQS